jgi:hypothetical protein
MIVYLLRLKTGDRVFTDGKEIYVSLKEKHGLRKPTKEEAEEITQKIYEEGRENK